jgi:thiol-disulfide isomerase/thioredoxin
MNYLFAIVAGIVGLMVLMQLLVRLKARAQRGRPLPELSDRWSRRLGGRASRLLYFFSPGCAACRPLTPRFQEISRRQPESVFVVNVVEELALARALNVMATPSVVEIADGIIVGFHLGPPPTEVMARYA